MKQDILIFSSRTDYAVSAYDALAKHDIPATIVTEKQGALSELHTNTPAFLLLDLDTCTASSIMAEIMEQFLCPLPYIILISSFSGSTDRASMLDQGADACIELPVDASEILAVLNSVLRREGRAKRTNAGSLMPCIEHKELFIDPLRRRVRMGGRPIDLTPKEFDLLHLLANSPGVVFSREQIYSHVWKVRNDLGLYIVSDHISSLRRKLGLHPKDRDYIQTVFKVGYRFAEHI